ncbi:MAG: FHA domain-containing protein [Pseudomonadota bacterium]|nr:FHA domain-containing protein [Pseudomonadota bacterium]
MEPVMLVDVLDDHGSVQQRHRVAGIGGQCRIGRSLACEIPVDDAFAAAEHARLTLQEDGRVLVQDLGSRNGTRYERHMVDPGQGRLIDGGLLQVGRTRVRVRTSQLPLPGERLFRRDLLQRHRTLLAATGVLLCLLFAAFMAWTREPDKTGEAIIFAVMLAILVLAIWAGTWTLVSRLTVGAWQLRIHLALASLCIAIWGWGFWLYTVAAFAFQWRWLGAFTAVLAGVVSWLAAWRHLRYATRLHRAAALTLGLLAPLLSGGVWWLVDLQVDPRTVNRVEHGARILPPSVRVAPSVDLGDYLTDVASLKREASYRRQQSLLAAPILDETKE